MSDAAAAAERVARESYGRLVARLEWHWRDLAAAGDVLADAFAAALRHWPEPGVPDASEAWLTRPTPNGLVTQEPSARRSSLPPEGTFPMHIQNSVVLVTGANRGLGRAFVKAILQAGATKIYAAARDPITITLQGLVPIQLDITSETDIAAAAAQCTDVTALINNAGIARGDAFTEAASAAVARAELETNFFGPLNLSLAFAPILKANGGGAIADVVSVLSWLNFRSAAIYSASKSAAWSLTNGLRAGLRSQGTRVVGVHVGFMDTDMASGIDMPKADPLDVARQTLMAMAEGKDEVLADGLSRQVKQELSAGAHLAQVG